MHTNAINRIYYKLMTVIFSREKYFDRLFGSDCLPLAYSPHSRQSDPLKTPIRSYHSMAQSSPLACHPPRIKFKVLTMIHKS